MSNNDSPSILAVAIHVILTLVTGGLWLFVLLTQLMLRKGGASSGPLAVAVHVILMLITGGFWFIALLIWFILKKKN